MWQARLMVLAACLALAGSADADLKQALAEPNLEKRSQLALNNAAAACKAARSAYEKGENEQVAAGIAEIQESVELAFTSLTQTGKDPRRSPKWFKRAEMDTRELIKRLEAFDHEMSFSDRPMLEKVRTKVQQVHDDLLVGLMQGKHK